MPNSLAKYYLHTESMADDSSVPIQEPLKLYEAGNVQRTDLICIGEIPDWMRPKVVDFNNGDGRASISICINGKDMFLELCNIDLKDVAHLWRL